MMAELIKAESDLTLEKWINVYNEAIKYIRILPIFIRNLLKNNDEENKKKAEKCFYLLINTYKAFKLDKTSLYKDSSFLNFLFERMISKFKKAGFNTYGQDFGSLKREENANEILKFPEFEILDQNKSLEYIIKKNFNEINKPIYDTNIFSLIFNGNKNILEINDYDTNLYDDKVEIIKKGDNTPNETILHSPTNYFNLPKTDKSPSFEKLIIINQNNNLNNKN